MWLIILLDKLWRAFQDWRDENDISWLRLIVTTVIVSCCIIFILGIVSMVKGCLNNFEKQQVLEEGQKIVKQQTSFSNNIEKGEKVKVTIQTKDGSQSFEGVFVERYSNIIGIKTDKGKVAFGGSFVVEEIK